MLVCHVLYANGDSAEKQIEAKMFFTNGGWKSIVRRTTVPCPSARQVFQSQWASRSATVVVAYLIMCRWRSNIYNIYNSISTI